MQSFILSAASVGSDLFERLSLTDVALIVVWIAILTLYVGAQLLRRPWKSGSALPGRSNRAASIHGPI